MPTDHTHTNYEHYFEDSVPLDHEAQPTEKFVFDHVPLLGPRHKGQARGVLLPKQGGVPGFIYAQIELAKMKFYEDLGWEQVDDTATYTIAGPKDAIDMVLMCRGKAIPSVDPHCNKRTCLFSNTLWERLGLDPATGFAIEGFEELSELTPEPGSESTEAQANTTTSTSPTSGSRIGRPKGSKNKSILPQS